MHSIYYYIHLWQAISVRVDQGLWTKDKGLSDGEMKTLSRCKRHNIFQFIWDILKAGSIMGKLFDCCFLISPILFALYFLMSFPNKLCRLFMQNEHRTLLSSLFTMVTEQKIICDIRLKKIIWFFHEKHNW